MLKYSHALVCALLVISALIPLDAKRTFGGGSRHSYPKSGGLSGSGGHHYPSSGGLSGGGHGYPSSGGSHSYPSSGGLSGGGTSGGNRGYPSSNNHGYPSSGNSHGYPSSGGLSGSGSNTHHTNTHTYPSGKGSPSSGGPTNVHHHYHYSPPQQISYAAPGGGPARSYPVYHGTPPSYVYQYKDSGSKYGTLIAGLALLNLGTLGASAYAIHNSNKANNHYTAQPGEICKFGVRKDNGDYEETRIQCELISSFILEEQAKAARSQPTNASVVTTTVTNVTVVNTTNPVQEPAPAAPAVSNIQYTMLPNGTLVPQNATAVNPFNNTTDNNTNNAMTSSVVVTTTTTNTTVANAIDVKGKPVEVTPGMQCYVIRQGGGLNMRKSVPCGVLQTYADKSIRRNSAIQNTPALTVLAIVAAVFAVY